jgi:hypothetical protein
MTIRLRLRTFRIPFLVAILLVSWLPLSSLKIVSDKILQSQESAGQFWDQTEAKLTQKRQILSGFPPPSPLVRLRNILRHHRCWVIEPELSVRMPRPYGFGSLHLSGRPR